MESIFREDKEKKITKPTEITFSVKIAGIYLIEILARAKGEKQFYKRNSCFNDQKFKE